MISGHDDDLTPDGVESSTLISSEPTDHNFDPESLRAVYPALQSMQIDFSERKWETIRAASFLALGLLAAVGGLVSQKLFQRWYVYLILALTLVSVTILLARWTNRNIIRESQLQYHVEFSMFQIERLLGLHKEVPVSWRWHPEVKHIFGTKHLDYRFHAHDQERFLAENDDHEAAWVEARAQTSSFLGTTGGFSLIVLVAASGVAVALLVGVIIH